jgi:acetamidase/formamidase
MTAGSARPLEDAFRVAQAEIIGWVVEDFGLEMLDAYQLVSQAVEAPIANVVDTNYTSVAKMAKRWLPPVDVYGGCHRRLGEVAAVYRAERA